MHAVTPASCFASCSRGQSSGGPVGSRSTPPCQRTDGASKVPSSPDPASRSYGKTADRSRTQPPGKKGRGPLDRTHLP